MGALPAAEATLTYANSLLDSDNDVTLKHMNKYVLTVLRVKHNIINFRLADFSLLQTIS